MVEPGGLEEGIRTFVDELAEALPSHAVRLLPAFDQYVLGPGTGDIRIIAPHRRGFVSKAAGWISPVVVAGGRVVGTWHATQDRVHVELFSEHADTSPSALAAEVERLASAAGARYTMSVTTV